MTHAAASAPSLSAAEWNALEKKVRARRGKRPTVDECWWVARRRASMAEAVSSKPSKQHLALASIFAGRGFRAGERDPERLTAYLGFMEAALAARCLPTDMLATKAHITRELRTAQGLPEPTVRAKKTRTIATDVALFMVADAAAFDGIADGEDWSDDAGRCGLVEAGRAHFVYTGCDGELLFRVRVVDGDHSLTPREYQQLNASTDVANLAVPSGSLRIGEPYSKPQTSIVLAVEPGAYAVSMHSLDYGDKVVILASHTEAATADNPPVPLVRRVGQGCGGLLELT